VIASTEVLARMLALVVVSPAPTTAAAPAPSQAAAVTQTAYAPASGLEACIIYRESGGNPQATNGIYSGLGQWSAAAWAQDGGTRYASSPLGASASQQEQVLASEGVVGMLAQQGAFDGCG
jgi:hypothetical protein